MYSPKAIAYGFISTFGFPNTGASWGKLSVIESMTLLYLAKSNFYKLLIFLVRPFLSILIDLATLSLEITEDLAVVDPPPAVSND